MFIFRTLNCTLIFVIAASLVSCSLKNRGNGASKYQEIEKNGDVIIEDPKSRLFWQRDVANKGMIWKEADEYCSKLNYGGFHDWRLPTISELKTLIKGCKSGTKSCKVNDKCLNLRCMNNACSCSENGGPGEDGFYWQKKVWNYKGDDIGSFWSSSRRATHAFYYWGVAFNNGSVDNGHRKSEFFVRCVRSK